MKKILGNVIGTLFLAWLSITFINAGFWLFNAAPFYGADIAGILMFVAVPIIWGVVLYKIVTRKSKKEGENATSVSEPKQP